MKKKLIVHIGTPKTGSSYLQELCLKNYDKLLALGILYPGIENNEFIKKANVPINGSLVLRLFFRELDRRTLCNLLEEKIKSLFAFNINTVLLSDETLSAFNVPHKGNAYIFECLIDICKRLCIEVKFLAYYRKPSKYLPSHWAQLVKKHNETLPLVEFVKKIKIPYWGYLHFLHSIHENVSIYSYDKEAKSQDGLATSFLNELNVDPSEIELLSGVSINKSLSLNSLTALRLINAEFDDDVIRHIEEIITKASPKNKLNKPLLSKEIELATDELYSDSVTLLQSISKSSY